MVSEEIVVSTRKGQFRVVRNTRRWDIDSVEFLGDNVSLALTDTRSGFGYAALDHGHFGVKLHRLTGDGWQEIAAPTYAQKPEGLDEKDMWGRPIPWSTQRIWALAAGGAGEPGVLWCGTLPGGLFRSTDHGDSWTMVGALWTTPSARSRWAAVPTGPAFTRYISIHAIHDYGSPFLQRDLVYRTMRAKAGAPAPRGIRAEHVPQNHS